MTVFIYLRVTLYSLYGGLVLKVFESKHISPMTGWSHQCEICSVRSRGVATRVPRQWGLCATHHLPIDVSHKIFGEHHSSTRSHRYWRVLPHFFRLSRATNPGSYNQSYNNSEHAYVTPMFSHKMEDNTHTQLMRNRNLSDNLWVVSPIWWARLIYPTSITRGL